MLRYLVGAHGTGKSTLLSACKDLYKEPFYTEGISRPVTKALKGLEIDPTTFQKIVNELTIAAYLQQINNNNVMATRSVIDVIVYTQILSPEIDIQPYLDIWNQTKNRIGKLIYIPIEIDLKEDDIRTGIFFNKEFQRKIDIGFRNFLDKQVDSDKIIIASGSVEERLEIIKDLF